MQKENIHHLEFQHKYEFNHLIILYQIGPCIQCSMRGTLCIETQQIQTCAMLPHCRHTYKLTCRTIPACPFKMYSLDTRHSLAIASIMHQRPCDLTA